MVPGRPRRVFDLGKTRVSLPCGHGSEAGGKKGGGVDSQFLQNRPNVPTRSPATAPRHNLTTPAAGGVEILFMREPRERTNAVTGSARPVNSDHPTPLSPDGRTVSRPRSLGVVTRSDPAAGRTRNPLRSPPPGDRESVCPKPILPVVPCQLRGGVRTRIPCRRGPPACRGLRGRLSRLIADRSSGGVVQRGPGSRRGPLPSRQV